MRTWSSTRGRAPPRWTSSGASRTFGSHGRPWGASTSLAGSGGTVLLFQKWVHDIEKWSALPVQDQEKVIGRTKADGEELDDEVRGPTSHLSRTDQEMDGPERPIFRRNTPYGKVTDHGTMFVGFSRDQAWLARMLARMAGAEDGIRDALTNYTTAVSGPYYWIPPIEPLRPFSSVEELSPGD